MMPSIMNTIGWIADSFGPAVRKSGRFASSMINDVKQRGVAEALKDAPQTKKAIFDTTQLKSARNSIDNLMVDFDAGELTKSADKYDRALQFASDSGFDTGEGLRDMSDALTKEIAEREGLPPYIIFHDSSLKDMCRVQPQSREEMLRVSGVGELKYSRYGGEFLDLIKAEI